MSYSLRQGLTIFLFKETIAFSDKGSNNAPSESISPHIAFSMKPSAMI